MFIFTYINTWHDNSWKLEVKLLIPYKSSQYENTGKDYI